MAGMGAPLARPTGLPAAIEALSDLVVVLGEGAIITWANPATVAASGFPAEEIVGQPITAFLHPDDVVRAAEVVSQISRQAGDEITPDLYRLAHRDGSWFTVELNGVPFDPTTGAAGSGVLVFGRVRGPHDSGTGPTAGA